jgi:pimeloyl-ACP methyl ester carboxylesterase
MKVTFLRATVLFAFIGFASSCSRYHNINVFKYTSSDDQIWETFAEHEQKPDIFYFRAGERIMRGWEIGDDSLPVTLLIHGAPSSMIKFRGLFKDTALTNYTKLVAVDRPGYGRSGYGKCEISIEKQAELIAPVLERLTQGGRKVTVLGMSYGGPVAAKLAMDHPDKVRALMLLSASVQPDAERTPGIAKLIRSPFGRIFPKYARVATKEKFAHSNALEAIQDDWSKVQCPVWIMHGQVDPLIYYSNAQYAFEKLAPHTDVTLAPFAQAAHNILRIAPDSVRHFVLEAIDCTGSEGCRRVPAVEAPESMPVEASLSQPVSGSK